MSALQEEIDNRTDTDVVNNLKTKKTWVIHTKTVKEKLTSFTQKT